MKKELVDQMTLQEACDYSVKKIVEQGDRCMSACNIYKCAYTDREGKHCAVGWLLDEDNEELMNFEGNVVSLCKQFGEDIPQLIRDNLHLFWHLQGFHDASYEEDRLTRLGKLSVIGVDTSGDHWKQWVTMSII